MQTKDLIYQNPIENIKNLNFDTIANSFLDMAKRSIPGYLEIMNLISLFSQKHLKNKSLVYDLGCSLGLACSYIAKANHDKRFQITALDQSKEMVNLAKIYHKKLIKNNILLVEQINILEKEFSSFDFAVLNFTMQFLKESDKNKLLFKLQNKMNKNAAIFISEKIKFNDKKTDNFFKKAHIQFKKTNGYSDLEIDQKEKSVENIMFLDCKNSLEKRFKNQGFKQIELIYQNLNFVSYYLRVD